VKRQSARPRLLFICHNVLPHEKSVLDTAALRLALSPGDGFVVHSKADAEKLLVHFPNAKVEVTPLPTYAALSESGAGELPADVPADRPLLLFGGFVRPYKGLDVLLDALPGVLGQRNVHLLVAGEFWNGDGSYREQIDRLGIGRAVTLVDRYLPNEVLAACINRSDVVVLPYRSATQSAIIQFAFGQNKPVITTNVGGLAEVVDDGRTGLVVPPEDPPALAAAINRFFDEDLGPGMAAAIDRENERFSWARLVNSLDQLASFQQKGVSGVP
jgi:glycosyltransferase involved in cell wall biosynthesis